MCEEAGNLNAKKFNEIDPSLLQKILTEIEVYISYLIILIVYKSIIF